MDSNTSSRLNINSHNKWIIFSVVLIVFLGLAYWFHSNTKKTAEERFFYKKLFHHISKNQTEILLGDLTNFSWEYVYYIGPYTYLKQSKGLQVNDKFYEVPERLQINLDSVGMWALCFISKKKVTHIIRGMKIKNRDRNLKQKLYDPNDIIVINNQNQFYLKVTK